MATGSQPFPVAVNSVTNKIYVANRGSGSVTVIDGTNNSTTTVGAGTSPRAIAVNSVTNKIYVANQGGNVTAIDGTDNSSVTIAAGTFPGAIAVNPVTNKIYVVNRDSLNVTVIDGAQHHYHRCRWSRTFCHRGQSSHQQDLRQQFKQQQRYGN